MVEFKLVIADPKTGKCVQKTVSEKAAESFLGFKIGDKINGEVIDLTGYEFEMTGGSDYCGFPMRKGIQGARKKILIQQGVGFKGGRKGMYVRKTVCGEAVHDKVTQINLKVVKYGKKALDEAPAAEENAQAASAEE